MQFSVMIAYNWEPALLQTAAFDASNFNALYVPDHPTIPVPDCWTFLAYIAGRTQRIRLGAHVIPAPLHHPAELAKQIATVDLLSGGRAVLGIGAGYNVHDFEPYGYTFPSLKQRIDMVGESVQIVKALWTRNGVTFDGECFQLNGGAQTDPKPVQQPHPPIFIGGNTAGRLAKIAAVHADGWNTYQLGPAQVREVKAVLDEECRAVGRDPASLRMTADVLMIRDGTPEAAKQFAEEMQTYARGAGRGTKATVWDASGVLHGDADAMLEQISRFAQSGVEELTVYASDVQDDLWFSERVIPAFNR